VQCFVVVTSRTFSISYIVHAAADIVIAASVGLSAIVIFYPISVVATALRDHSTPAVGPAVAAGDNGDAVCPPVDGPVRIVRRKEKKGAADCSH
jgi:hypothetical protein